MTSINLARQLGGSASARRHFVTRAAQRHGQLPPDPEIIVDRVRLNKCLDSLEGLSGQ